MDLKTKLYQMFILGTEGDGYIQALENGLGGIIFFTKDIQSKDQFKNLISDIKSKALIAPFLSIDQEGGRVERTEKIFVRQICLCKGGGFFACTNPGDCGRIKKLRT